MSKIGRGLIAKNTKVFTPLKAYFTPANQAFVRNSCPALSLPYNFESSIRHKTSLII
ncbi:hypothetical protein [Emticicia sp. C21]|uniref:hypothetical protein n=1 Tax=Emticicia sp. C21 TaxID=2302915 RepID=UPI001314C0DD|nr:hypothetical protein [Emticicia sp. C21]